MYALTIVHHVYGAVVFDTAWRHHAALVGLGGVAATIACASGAVRLRTAAGRQAAYAALLVLTLVLAVGAFGLFEGGYNHALKNFLFFNGAAPDTLERLFPRPTYEMPRDAIFEITGVLQLFAGLSAAVSIAEAYWRARQ